MNFGCNHKHGFKSDALFANILLRARGFLSTLSNLAYCSHIFSGESIFIRIDNDLVTIYPKFDVGLSTAGGSFPIVVVFGILDQFKNESGFTFVEVRC